MQSADHYFLITSLLEYISVVINKDPELTFVIFECECSFIAIKVHNISKKRQEKEERKRCSVWMRPYLTWHITTNYDSTLAQQCINDYSSNLQNFLSYVRSDFRSTLVHMCTTHMSYNARVTQSGFLWGSRMKSMGLEFLVFA